MARRKVTMLEAFQASERATAEQAVSEQRRLAAEREKDARREEAARAAQDWKRRIGEGVGSLFAGRDETEGAGAAPGRARASEGESSESAVQNATGRGREPSWSSSGLDEGDLVDANAVASHGGFVAMGAPAEHPESAEELTAGAAPRPDAADDDAMVEPVPHHTGSSDAEDGGEDPPSALDDLTPEQLAEASAEPPEFAIPMTARGFAVVACAALAGVFVLGMKFGSGGGAVDAGDGEESGRSRAAAAPYTFDRPAGAGAAASDRALPPPSELFAPENPRAEPEVGEEALSVEDRLSAVDRAFVAPETAFSILSRTYNDSADHTELAWSTYDALADRGFPVVRPFLQGRRIFLFVGAAQSRKALEETASKLRSVELDGAKEFRDAQIVNVDRFR